MGYNGSRYKRGKEFISTKAFTKKLESSKISILIICLGALEKKRASQNPKEIISGRKKQTNKKQCMGARGSG